MKIVIAPDSFKGSLASAEVADAMERGIMRACADVEVVKMPLADGGEGTMRVLVNALGGETVTCEARDPLGRLIEAEYGVVAKDGNSLAVIEMASASGLTLVKECDRDALRASSAGVGDLILDALDRGCRDFVIGIGGSATTDAGKGMLERLGVRFLGRNGDRLADGGGSLCNLVSIDVAGMDYRLKDCRFSVACDVDNVLYGENGAAYVFAPQKGASESGVVMLDAGLRRFSACVSDCMDVDVSAIKGGGAAGGLGAAFVAFLGADLRRGVDVVLDAVGFDMAIRDADVVLTGEGKMDRQTLMGKLPSGVLLRAKRADVPVFSLAGRVEDGSLLRDAGFARVMDVNRGENMDDAMIPEVAMRRIESSVERVLGEMWQCG